MAEYSQEQIVYKVIPNIRYENYHFKKVDDGFIFSFFELKPRNLTQKIFLKNNFRDIADCYYFSMLNDSVLQKDRKRKLITFLNSIWDQDDVNVSLLIVKAIKYYNDKLSEDKLVEKIIKEILPNANYYKVLQDRKYLWKWDERKKFDLGIGRFFVLSYINSNFNKDITWKIVKKNCFLNDNKWFYKNGSLKQKISDILSLHVKNGGIIMDNIEKEFNAFIPFTIFDSKKTGKEAFVSNDCIISKSKGDGKSLYLYGAASTTDVDVDDERVSENFIKSMKKQAVGLPLKIVSHSNTGDVNQTIGMIVDKGGDKDTFMIEGKLHDPEMNDNVKKLSYQMDFGNKYGFSIYGRVTKVFREYNKALKKDVYVLDDGSLSHVLVTDQPANKSTFAEAIVKSFRDGDKPDRDDFKKDLKHSSAISKYEPDDIDIDSLPDQAFPINYSDDKIYKEYPHHFVGDDGNLYLHRQSLLNSFRSAQKNNESQFIINHLNDHLQISGLSNIANDLMNIVANVEKMNNVKNDIEKLGNCINDYCKGVKALKKMDSNMEHKLKIANKLAEEVAPVIKELLNNISDEVNNG